MKQVFHPYTKWEDWKDGLYDLEVVNPREKFIGRSERLLSSVDLLRSAMLLVIHGWPYAAEQNLSNGHRNRQAWLGQAACCLITGATEDLTKEAWHRLSQAQKDAANMVADYVIAVWEQECCGKN